MTLIPVAFGGNNTRGPIDIATARKAHGGAHGRLDFESETFVAHTLRGDGFNASEDGTGGGTPLVPVVFDTTQITSDKNFSSPKPGDPCHPLAAGAHAPAVAFCERGRGQGRTLEAQEELAYALTNPGSGGRTHSRQLMDRLMRVRRIMPVEAERLQGFPDGWTSGGVMDDGTCVLMADGPRYRMLGNAVSVPVAEWIGRRIVAVDDFLS